VLFLVGVRKLGGPRRFGGIEEHRPFLLLCRLFSSLQGRGQCTMGPDISLLSDPNSSRAQSQVTPATNNLSLPRARNSARCRSLTLNQVSPPKLSSFPHIHFLNSAARPFFSSSSTATQSNFRLLRNSVRSDLSSDSNLCLKSAVSDRMNRDRRSGLIWSAFCISTRYHEPLVERDKEKRAKVSREG
jgi:hypothetical protein